MNTKDAVHQLEMVAEICTTTPLAEAALMGARALEAEKMQLSEEGTTFKWIPCSERMPEEPFGCIVTVWDTDPVTMDEFENLLPYFVGWDGEQWNDADGEQCPFEVIAWCKLPVPYKGGDADET